MKRVLVTGGTRGIGLACVRLFAEKGYLVTATYSSDEESAKRAKKEVPEAVFLRADVSDEGKVKETISSLPSLDVLVCNAGVSSFSQVQDVEERELDRVLAVNVKGTVYCCKHAARKLMDSRGSIVTVSSVWGETGGSCESVYSASKGAVIAFSKALAKELAPMGVRVNCVCPGVVDTKMNARFFGEERKKIEEDIPLGRFASPEEIASAVLFLAEHSFITGQTLGVNGGQFI